MLLEDSHTLKIELRDSGGSQKVKKIDKILKKKLKNHILKLHDLYFCVFLNPFLFKFTNFYI